MIYAVLSLRECQRVGALSNTLHNTCARCAHANGLLKGQFQPCMCLSSFCCLLLQQSNPVFKES